MVSTQLLDITTEYRSILITQYPGILAAWLGSWLAKN